MIMDLSKTFGTINNDLFCLNQKLIVSRKILFHLLQAFLPTGTSNQKLAIVLVPGIKP